MTRSTRTRGTQRREFAGLAIALLTLIAFFPSSARAVDLVSKGATWLYLDDESNQGTAWREAGFADGGWASGAAQLGYGDGDEATVVNGGPSGDRYATTYFRTHFNVADPASVAGLTLGILRDDGAIVYLNGTEVHRSNMAGGAIAYSTFASAVVGGAAESTFNETPVLPSLLVSGDNVLAVEIHQGNSTSSDISFDLELVTAAPAGAPSLVRTPYLQMGTPSSMIVRWRTDTFTDTRLAYGSAPGSLGNVITDPTPKTEHEVSISGLTADTRYYYEIGNAAFPTLAGDDADHFFNTSPVPGTQRATRIWVIGDAGQCAAAAQGCIDAAAVMNEYLNWVASNGGNLADMVLILGDNAYGTGTDTQYTQGLFEVFGDVLRNHVLWPVPGNHEFGASDSPSQTGPYYEAFSLPMAGESGGVASGTEAYYSYDFGRIHIVGLDSHDTSRSAPASPQTNICPGGGGGGAMYNWLCTDMAMTNQDWILTFWHHPPYTKGSHNSDVEGQLQEMREKFNPVIEAYGADLNLTGHSHSYERSVLIDGHYGNSGSYNPGTHAKDAGDGDPDPGGDGAYQKPAIGPDPNEGMVYSVVGSSSKNSGGLTQHAIMSYWENYEGSLVIDIAGNQLDGYFINKDGAENDHFRIFKGPGAVCGNGNLEAGEDCDDANTLPGDCCSAVCAFETLGSTCDDLNACTAVDTCDGAGSCQSGSALACDDSNGCTDNNCDPATGCVFPNNTAACDDLDACTVSDTCSGGSCQSGSALACDDSNGCTDNNCDPATGCVFPNNTAACDDLDACTVSDTCSGGSCQAGSALACDDANGCTDDTCDPATGCVFPNNTATCDDVNACTVSDTCSGGSCQPGSALDCDDFDPLTAESCDALTGCVHTPIEEPVEPVPALSEGGRVVLVAVLLLVGFGLRHWRRAEHSV